MKGESQKAGNRKTLGDNIVPLNYRLLFEPNFNTFRYRGSETIKVDIRRGSDEIKINSAELEIKNAEIKAGASTYKGKIKTDEKEEQATILFDREIKGSAELRIEFEGTNNDKMYGFYRSRYTDKGKESYILTSQFEAVDARKAFPCFDEPAFKATFDVSFLIDRSLTGISNMPVHQEKEAEGGKKLVTFMTTPKMSPYLLYLGIGRFEAIEDEYRGIKFRCVTVPGKSGKTHMALEYGMKFLEFYESYFGIKFPLPKMDLLAIPDFSAGAMENWGAVTFREVELYGDEKSTSISVRQRIAEVIAHELAHQWFGDLVTMAWWDDLWLNESFATFMARKAVDHVLPKWEFDKQQRIGSLSTALSADQYLSTHPINVKVNEPEEIDQIFDEISYEKGGSVLTMLEDYVGEDNFRKGLHSYLKKHSYSNARKEDLWNAIADVASDAKKFSKVAQSWVDKPGYPMIEVKPSNNGRTLEQRRYLMLRSKDDGATWPIPVHYMSAANSGFMLLDKKSGGLPIEGKGWVKLNHMQKGIYRVRYPDTMLKELGAAIKSEKLDYVDAWGVESDLYALARSSREKVSAYLDFLESYCMDGDYPLNSSVSGHLASLKVLLSDNSTLSKRIADTSIKYHRAALKRLTWTESKDERNVATIFRSMAVSSLGMNGDTEAIERARQMFGKYAATGEKPPKNLKTAAYTITAWNGDKSTFEKIVELYRKEEEPEDRRRLLQALGSFREPSLIRRALDFSRSKDVRLQDGYVIPMVASGNEFGKKEIWPWLRENWQSLMDTYSSGTHMLSRFVDFVDLVDDKKRKAEIETFFADKKNMRKDMERALMQALELMDVNIRFVENNR